MAQGYGVNSDIGNMACEACRDIKIKQEYKAGKGGKRVGLDWEAVVGK